MKQPIIEMNHVNFTYERQRVLEDINIIVEQGSFLGLVGPNGSGKTTLLKCLLGLLKPQSGEIMLFGQSIQKFKNWH